MLMASNLISRRQSLHHRGAYSLLAAGLWPGAQHALAKAGESSFQFIAVNDLHHDSPECDPWFEALVRDMKKHSDSDFALVLGDLTDRGQNQNLGAIRDHLQQLTKPVHVQIGNHDYLTPSDRSAYEKNFPNQLNYAFTHKGWQFVGIDSTQGQDYSNTKIQPPTFHWLDRELPRLDKRRPTVLFTHFPLAPTAPMVPTNAEAVLNRFLEFNLKGVYSGHHHGFTLNVVRGVDVLTNRCCSRLRNNHDGSKEKGYWLISATPTSLSRSFVEFTKS